MKSDATISKIVCMVLTGLLLSGCSDSVSQKPSDLSKYPQYEIFFRLCGDFKDGALNTDVNSIFFHFKDTSSNDAQSFFNDLNSKVTQQQWTSVKLSKDSWQYSKAVAGENGSSKEQIYSIVVQRDDAGIVTLSF